MMDDWQEKALERVKNFSPEAKQIRKLAMDNLLYFATLVNEGYMYGEIHEECFKWLQDYALYGKGTQDATNKLMLLPRGHLKSHMVATCVAWLITRHPEITILYLSATTNLASDQLYAIKRMLTSRAYSRYFPEYINPQEGQRERWTSERINIDHPKRKKEGIRDSTVAIAGLTTNTTGWHADVLVADDLVVPENAYTEDGRESVRKKVSQFTSILNAGGYTLACGTRYHPADIYDSWKKQQYEIFNDEGEVERYQNVWDIKEYAVEEDGKFLWERVIRPSDLKAFGFDKQVLARIKAQYEDKVQFFAQYYNDPNDMDSARIAREKFQYYDKKHIHNEGGEWFFKEQKLNVYAAIDFAFSLSRKSDYTAIVVIGIASDGLIYILDIDRFRTDKIVDYFSRLKALHSKWGFRRLRAEVTVAQSVIVKEIKRAFSSEGLPISVDEYRPTGRDGSKEERIAAILEYRYDDMLIYHFKGGYTDVLEEELILARPPHDDIKDALASAVEIAIKPKQRKVLGFNSKQSNLFSSRFGGVAFR